MHGSYEARIQIRAKKSVSFARLAGRCMPNALVLLYSYTLGMSPLEGKDKGVHVMLPHHLGLHCVLGSLLGSARLVLDALERIVVNLRMSPEKHIRLQN